MTDAMRKTNLYEDLVAAAEECFGPSASHFIGRLILTRLNKHPNELTQQDIEELADWMQITASLMAENTQAIDKFTKRVHTLSGGGSKNEV